MNQLILLFSLLLSIFYNVEAQSYSNQDNSTSSSSQGTFGGFQPSIAVVLVILVVMIILSIVLAMYMKFSRIIAIPNENPRTPIGLMRPGAISSGIDRIVIQSLPFFKFSSLKGLRGGLDCAVCLSKFEDIEVLRLLPKCKHAFHINCVDQWLENHSSCPLCRQKISVDDLMYSNSLRFISSQSDVRGDSNVELFVQREDSRRHGSSRFRQGSSRFSIGSSFRIFEKGVVKEDELPIREDCEGAEENGELWHRFNHKIIMCDAVQTKMPNSVLKSRWSNLSSSDLLFLNSEMLGDVSSNRFPHLDPNLVEKSTSRATEEGGILNVKEEMERKRDFETKFAILNQKDSQSSHPLSSGGSTSNPKRNLGLNDKRSMSEIAVHSRFKEVNTGGSSVIESSVPENAAKEERLKRLWLPIARRTVQRFANRDRKSQPSASTRQSMNV